VHSRTTAIRKIKQKKPWSFKIKAPSNWGEFFSAATDVGVQGGGTDAREGVKRG
jgi:hypothetical protein